MNEPGARQQTRRTPTRRQLLGILALLVLVVVALVLISNSSGLPGDPGTPGAAGPMTTAPTTTAPTTIGISTKPSSNPPTSSPTTGIDPDSGLPFVAASALPQQARDTLALIASGGPYPFPRNDNQTYFNNNRVLPRHPSGYYREYTVITPGAKTRGARRIIAGEAGELYYTADHYDSFRRILENR